LHEAVAGGKAWPGRTFERAPPPALANLAVEHELGKTRGSPFTPAHDDESEQRAQRQLDLDGDEALAMQLAAQLRLTTPAELDTIGSENCLPRVGGSSVGVTPADDSEVARSNELARSSELDRRGSMDEGGYGVEYHALVSDGEEDPLPDPPRVGICSMLTSIFRTAGPWGRDQGMHGQDLPMGLR